MRSAIATVIAFAIAAGLPACQSDGNPPDTGALDASVLPASCLGCPHDCCLLPDGGAACLNWGTRNPVTLQCACGTGPACAPPEACCPPTLDPLPSVPPPVQCVATPGACDPRPQQ